MRISAKGRYSLAAMTYLALRYQAEKPIPLIAISESLGISKIYLEQVFTILKRTNLVISIKGPQGGYLLTKNPNEINIFEILHPIEDNLFEETPQNTAPNSPQLNTALQQIVFTPLASSINETLEKITLSQLAISTKEQLQQSNFMYYI
mgnify:FL=1